MTKEIVPVGPIAPRDRRAAERRNAERRAGAAPPPEAAAEEAAASPARAAPAPAADPGAAVFAAQVMGQSGQRRGLRGGPPVLDAARAAYLETRFSGKADRRPKPGAVGDTDI